MRSPSTPAPTTFAAALLALLLGLAVSGAACMGARPAETFQFRNGPAHEGVHPPGVADSLAGLAWRFATGGVVRASPVSDGRTVYCGSSDGSLYALDAATGALRWRADLGSSIGCAPAVGAGRVVAGTRDGRIVALDAARGRVVWTRRTGPDRALPWGKEGFDFWTSSPLLAGGLLFVGSGDGALYALDPATGGVRWRAETEGRVRSSPATDGAAVYVGSCDGSVYAFEVRSGRRRWRFDTDGRDLDSGKFGFDRKSIYSSPAVAGRLVFVGGRDGKFYALDAATGRERWRADFGTSWVMGAPAVRDGRVFVSTSDGHQVRCLAQADGKETWRFETTSALWASPSLTGDLAIVTDWGGEVIALDAATGREAWRERLPRPVLTAAWPDRERIYVSADDGGVYALARGRHGLERAVYWDSTLAGSPQALPGHRDVRDYFVRLGYRLLSGRALAAYLAARVGDRAASVVVCALDGLPAVVTDSSAAGGPSLLRRYLEAEGKLVWLGVPPLITGDPMKPLEKLEQIDRARPAALLGVGFEGANYDPLPSYPTAAGRAWGLDGVRIARWSADSASVTEVLARDENGGAGSWIRNFGGPKGSGFVMLPLNVAPGGHPANLLEVQVAAEHVAER